MAVLRLTGWLIKMGQVGIGKPFGCVSYRESNNELDNREKAAYENKNKSFVLKYNVDQVIRINNKQTTLPGDMQALTNIKQ